MSSRTIKLLHVEDEISQHRLLAHYLLFIDEFQFDILYAEAEENALNFFDRGGAELVILDYDIRHGNGSHCLEELRRREQIVPIIAVSMRATAEITADLLRAGADDYIGKYDVTNDTLPRILRETLARADVWRRRQAIQRGKGRT
jgi:two-component system, OmpR family, response regulator RegX3